MVVASWMQVEITPLARSALVYLFPHLDYRPPPSVPANTLASPDNPANMEGETDDVGLSRLSQCIARNWPLIGHRLALVWQSNYPLSARPTS